MKGEYKMIQNFNTQHMLVKIEMTSVMNTGSVIDLCVTSPSPLDLVSAPKALQQAF